MNKVSKILHNMIGTEQRMTSVYHPQSNGLRERQNRTIKGSLVKVFDGNWYNIIEVVLFGDRVSKHTSKTFHHSPNQELTLSMDIKYNLVDIDGNESEHPFDRETFDAVLTTGVSMIANIHQTAGENICSAQEKKRRD